MSQQPEWLTRYDVLVFQRELIAAFGGAGGVREMGLLESALARPLQVYAYESHDLVVLAGAYAHSLAKNHPFVDGNKRVSFVVARVFLGINGVAFDPPEADAVVMIEGLAAGSVSLADFTEWIRKHCAPSDG